MIEQLPKFEIKHIKAIVGLGNPGANYYKTRHNIGFRIIDVIVEQFNSSFKKLDNMECAQINLNDVNIDIIKPLTFMNNSGQVMPYLKKKGIKANEILVIHDELEKDFGKVSTRFGGSAKGHNGLRSIINFIGPDFWRLRFGIGRPENKANVGDYVLTNFSASEEAVIPELIEKQILCAMV